MRVLVTGGTGFCGSHLVRRLLDSGREVTVLDKESGTVGRELESAGAKIEIGSVTDAEFVDRAVRGNDIVYHLASAFRDINASDDTYWDIDVNGTRNVLAAAKRHKVRRVVHCSTQGVHGSLEETPGNEESPITPNDYYCYSKYQAELVCQEFIQSGMDVTIIRPTSIYGPGDLYGWLKLHRIVRSGRFLMLGDGRTLNHPVFIENLIDALELAATVPEAKGRTYLIADEEPVTLNRLVTTVADASNVDVRIIHLPLYAPLWLVAAAVELVCKPFRIDPPIFRRRLSWFRTNRAFSIDRAKRELGYRPAVDLSQGLAQTAGWYEQQGLLPSRSDRAGVRSDRAISTS